MPSAMGGLLSGLGQGLAQAGQNIGQGLLIRKRLDEQSGVRDAQLKQNAALGIMDRAINTFIKDPKIAVGAKVRVYEDTVRPSAAKLGFFLPPMGVEDFQPQFGQYLQQFNAILKSGGSVQEKQSMIDATLIDITTRDPQAAMIFKRFDDQLKEQTERNVQEQTARYVRVIDGTATDEDRQHLAYEQAIATSPDASEDLPVVRQQKQDLALALHEAQKRALKEMQERRIKVGEDQGLLEQTPTGGVRQVPVTAASEGVANVGPTGVGSRASLPSVREPTESEVSFFRQHPTVTGMATTDNAVTLNPFSNLSSDERQAVIRNEQVRVLMRAGRAPRPTFALTDEQRTLFKDYGDEQAQRETIAARILSGDPSAGKPTSAQRAFVQQLGSSLSETSQTKTTSQSDDIRALDNEIRQLLATRGRARVVGGPTTQDINKRIDQLQGERKRFIDEQNVNPERRGAARFAELIRGGKNNKEAASQALREHGSLPNDIRVFVPELEQAEIARRAATGVGVVKAEREEALRQPLPGDLKALTGFDTLGKAQDAGFVFDLKTPEVRKFRQQLGAAKDAFRRMDRVQDIVKKTPEAFGLVGSTMAVIEGAIAQATNALTLLQRDTQFDFTESQGTLRRLAPIFSAVGITNRRLQSEMQGLVIRVAETEGFVGRELTDRKIQLMSEIVTGATQSPAALNAVVDDLRQRVHEKLQFDSTSVLGAPGRPILTPEQLGGKSSRPTSGGAPTEGITILRRRPAQ